jgi:uncharacterized iron-regulated membrane protein
MPGLGMVKIPELVAVASWYLWWERRRATRAEKIQEPERSTRSIYAVYSNFYVANAPRAKFE